MTPILCCYVVCGKEKANGFSYSELGTCTNFPKILIQPQVVVFDTVIFKFSTYLVLGNNRYILAVNYSKDSHTHASR